MPKKITILGSGFSSLAAASYLAQAGHEVHIYEKNATLGGRARQYKRDGFTFDMGPSWYWMPDVFDRFFADFGKKTSDFYNISKLDPAYRVYFGKHDSIAIGDSLGKIKETFEAIEPGSAQKLQEFIDDAGNNYEVAIKDLVYRPGVSPLELVTPQTIKKIGSFFSTISRDVRKAFKNPKLIQILEFPVLFLGAKPSDTPSFYSFMNYADFGIGTFHPKNGMHAVIEGMITLAESLGVQMHANSTVESIVTENNIATGITVNGKTIKADIVLSGADYHHTETLLPKNLRQYSETYWGKKTFAPSSLLFYVGFDKKLEHVNHHTLFFDTDFDKHAVEIYDKPKWPDAPLFYANFPSISDMAMAPEGKEAGFFLIPLAPGLHDTQDLREEYFDRIINRLEELTGQSVKKNIIFKESFCVKDFVEQYNSYKGNAYGLANTLLQTAFLRPKLKSKKVANLYFTGQLTVPGPGVPPALISGKLVAGLITKNDKKKK
ncbi:phytoene desaturase family protein [Leeuwenhoekiella palythoae]|uniref:Phytoene desaturase n=1 Tax=Leeuwenhoekiella palythoae TaxID=573501 RepID=A0A1M5TC36_9FLAO|nr:phytoene desaturase family protein [Leeuwenhoekiella palythoae]RXG28708.1 phytoene desaturase [Leeuwenhoekiella palythoae]SHH48279.1 phytoene desaturase [Leeuwenhoekiella palythoae]